MQRQKLNFSSVRHFPPFVENWTIIEVLALTFLSLFVYFSTQPNQSKKLVLDRAKLLATSSFDLSFPVPLFCTQASPPLPRFLLACLLYGMSFWRHKTNLISSHPHNFRSTQRNCTFLLPLLRALQFSLCFSKKTAPWNWLALSWLNNWVLREWKRVEGQRWQKK